MKLLISFLLFLSLNAWAQLDPKNDPELDQDRGDASPVGDVLATGYRTQTPHCEDCEEVPCTLGEGEDESCDVPVYRTESSTGVATAAPGNSKKGRK